MSNIEINIPALKIICIKLDEVLQKLDQQINNPEHIILDNEDMMKYLKISKTKAATIRNEGKISFSKQSQTGKIWYKLSDILDYVDSYRMEKFDYRK